MTRSSSRRRLGRGHVAPRYVVDARNVHALAASLETYARDRHYAVCYDASIWARFETLLGQQSLETLSPKRLVSLQVFYGELLRIFEAYDNSIIIPEIKIEFANLIAATHAQIDRHKLSYQRLSPAKKDRVARSFSALFRLDELLRKLRTRLELRVQSLPETNPAVLKILRETVIEIASALSLKKPEVTPSEVDERLVARAFHEVLWNQRRAAIYTRDEDVRRITSSVYKLIVSQTVRDEGVSVVVKALKLGNLVVLKYNADREEYCRFFESQTQAEIGQYIFSQALSERAKIRLVTLVRTNVGRLGRLLLDREDAAAHPKTVPTETDESRVHEALGLLHDRLVWYQEVARAVGVSDVQEEIRVTQAFRRVVGALRYEELEQAVDRTLEGFRRKRILQYLRELEEKERSLRNALRELTSSSSDRQSLKDAERLGQIAGEVASTAREKHFFARALGMGDFHVTKEDFRRTDDLLERLLGNGFDVREGPAMIPAADLADLTGRSYQAILRLASEQDLVAEGGLVRVDLTTVTRHLI